MKNLLAEENMKIVYFDVDALFWRAYNNIRLIDFEKILRNVNKLTKADVIYCVADFSTKEYLKPVIDTLSSLKKEMPVEIVDGYSSAEKRNLTDISITNMFYQSIMNSDSYDTNQYTIVASNTKYLSMAKFLQERSTNKVNFILANDIEALDSFKTMFNVLDTIDIKEDKKSIFDKTIIKEIYKVINWSNENNRYMTEKNIVDNLVEYSKVKHEQAEYLLHALISKGYLEKKMLVNNSQEPPIKYLVVVMGNQEESDKLLASFE